MKTIRIVILLCTLFSCQSKQNKVQDQKDKHTKTEQVYDSLVIKYNIKYEWDTINFIRNTIDFNDILATKYQIIKTVFIEDIYQEDSTLFCRVNPSSFPYHFTFEITKEQKDQLTQKRKNITIVVSIPDIRKTTYKGEKENFEYMNVNEFNGKGKIIEIATNDL